MKSPLISILMVFHNEEKYISKSIDSILNQDYSNFELILINDSSKDNSLKIAESFENEKIVIINNTHKNGKSFCLNQGIKISQGKYLAICDADDVYLKNRFTAPLSILEYDKSITICGAQAQLSTGVNAWTNPTKSSIIDYRILFRNPLINSSVLIRKSFLIKNNIEYNISFNRSEDYKLWADCVLAGAKIANSNESTIIYTVKSTKADEKQIMEANIVRKQLWKKYGIDSSLLRNILDFSNFKFDNILDIHMLKSKIKGIADSQQINNSINKLWVEDLVNNGKSIFFIIKIGQLYNLCASKNLIKKALKNIF